MSNVSSLVSLVVSGLLLGFVLGTVAKLAFAMIMSGILVTTIIYADEPLQSTEINLPASEINVPADD